jgi:multicomponent K+:H+ antiporter subunit A
VRWIAVGLLFAAGTGTGSWLFLHPFLTSYSTYAELLVIGSVPLATALVFDLGVFSLVVGATALMLVALAHQSIRGHRAPSPRVRITAAAEES